MNGNRNYVTAAVTTDKNAKDGTGKYFGYDTPDEAYAQFNKLIKLRDSKTPMEIIGLGKWYVVGEVSLVCFSSEK